MLLPGRHGNTGDYRYGFNGMEADDELKGEGNSYDFGERMYDPRVGRWFRLDGFQNLSPDHSNYSFSLNNPIYFIDADGDVARDPNGNPIYFVMEPSEHAILNHRQIEDENGNLTLVRVEERVYFTDTGVPFVALAPVSLAKQDYDPVTGKSTFQDVAGEIKKEFKSVCFAEALHNAQFNDGALGDNPIERMELLIEGFDLRNQIALTDILKNEFEKLDSYEDAKVRDLIAFSIIDNPDTSKNGFEHMAILKSVTEKIEDATFWSKPGFAQLQTSADFDTQFKWVHDPEKPLERPKSDFYDIYRYIGNGGTIFDAMKTDKGKIDKREIDGKNDAQKMFSIGKLVNDKFKSKQKDAPKAENKG